DRARDPTHPVVAPPHRRVASTLGGLRTRREHRGGWAHRPSDPDLDSPCLHQEFSRGVNIGICWSSTVAWKVTSTCMPIWTESGSQPTMFVCTITPPPSSPSWTIATTYG